MGLNDITKAKRVKPGIYEITETRANGAWQGRPHKIKVSVEAETGHIEGHYLDGGWMCAINPFLGEGEPYTVEVSETGWITRWRNADNTEHGWTTWKLLKEEA